MRAEIEALAQDIQRSVALLKRHLDWDAALMRLDELNALAENPDLWNDAAEAQKIMRERNELDMSIQGVRSSERELADLLDLIELGEAEGDQAVVDDAEAQIRAIKEKAAKMELETLLSGEADHNDCYMEINAGAGGTESQDWAEMLLRMYIRYCERRGWKTEITDYQAGDEAGVKGVTLMVSGEYAYGYLKAEIGIHRLVRISPFDSNARRHTSFASVFVFPEIADSIDVKIVESDLRVDTYRSSGAGGQHVNTTDSAVRITHLPTGVVVACQTERSQHLNKATAMRVLRAKLYEKEVLEREAQAAEISGEKKEIGWGSQIRSYVLHPYKMVKDLRTGVESGNPDAVLDGDLEEFIVAYLMGVRREVKDT